MNDKIRMFDAAFLSNFFITSMSLDLATTTTKLICIVDVFVKIKSDDTFIYFLF